MAPTNQKRSVRRSTTAITAFAATVMQFATQFAMPVRAAILCLLPALAMPAPAVAAGVRVQLQAQGDGTATIPLLHPFLDLNPNALLAISASDSNGTTGIDASYSSWWRITANGPNIPNDAHFWVLAFDTDSGFRHLTTEANTGGHVTILNHPRLNGHPDARPIVTREAFSGQPAIAWPFGVYYTGSAWAIFFEDIGREMPIGGTFSVFIPDEDEQSYVHTATAENINSSYTIFDSAGIDQSLPHRLFITHRWTGVYNDAWPETGWLFSHLIGNVGGSAMPVGAAFNVFIPAIFEDGFEMGSTVLWSDTVP
jgi:hypothetical protein